MIDYQKGKIYELYDVNTQEMLYIGSTTFTLSDRLNKHRAKCKRTNSPIYNYIKDNNIEYKIRLIEEYPCDNKNQLTLREGHFQRLNYDSIHNVRIEGRTKQDFYIDNRERKLEYMRQYHIDNKEVILEKMRQRYHNNKDKK